VIFATWSFILQDGRFDLLESDQIYQASPFVFPQFLFVAFYHFLKFSGIFISLWDFSASSGVFSALYKQKDPAASSSREVVDFP
jgi:hypothetical protein